MTSIDEQRRLLLERMRVAGRGRDLSDEGGRRAGGQQAGAVRVRRRAGQPQAKPKWRIPPKVRQYLPYVVVLLVILAPLLHDPPRDNRIPKHLIGVWKSETPGYQDRYLMFVERNVAFGTGGYDGESYIVAEVQSSPVGDEMQGAASMKTLYTIRYMKADRVEYDLSFYYQEKPVETITFKNQETLKWTRKGAKS